MKKLLQQKASATDMVRAISKHIKQVARLLTGVQAITRIK